MTDLFVLRLAPFALFDPQPSVPHRRRVLASCEIRQGTRIDLCSNHGRTLFWASASKDGLRMARTSRTSSKAVASRWEEAVCAGRVEILPDDDAKSRRSEQGRSDRAAARLAERTVRGRHGVRSLP